MFFLVTLLLVCLCSTTKRTVFNKVIFVFVQPIFLFMFGVLFNC